MRKLLGSYFFVCVFVLMVPIVSSSLIINEIMYNPTLCSDTYCEWIELYNPTNNSLNITGWTLCGNTLLAGFVNHTDRSEYENEGLQVDPVSFAVITDGGSGTDVYNNYNINKSSIALHVDASALCGGLHDSSDIITLISNEGSSIDSFEYTDELGADGNNFSLEKRDDGSWGESIQKDGTPGSQNSIATLSQEYSVLEITEFLPNPGGDDNLIKPQGEWVEIFNSGTSFIVLAGLFLTDKSFSNELYISYSTILSSEGTIIGPGEYKIIYRSGDSDFSLNNNGYDEVHLYTPDEKEILQVSYSGSIEGMSWSDIDGIWYQTQPTPGMANRYKEGCDWALDIEYLNSIFTGDDFEFTIKAERVVGSSASVTIRGEIQDINGNIIKEYSPWTNSVITTSNSKSYTPNLKEGTYQLRFWFEDLSCDDYNIENNEINILVAINEQYLDDESTLEIEKMYLGNDQTAKWGDLFRVKTNMYKGKTGKYTVELWAEKEGVQVSKRTKVNVHDPFTYYSVTLPLFLEANCNEKYSDGRVILVLNGLDQETTETFTIEGNDRILCDQSSVPFQESSNEDTNLEESFELINLPSSIHPGDTIPINAQFISDNFAHTYTAWVYLYKGRTCYSCSFGELERDYSKKEIIMQPNEVKQIPYELIIDEKIEPGEYKLKLKLEKDDLVTPKEVTYDITITNIQEESLSLYSTKSTNSSKQFFSAQNEITSAAILHSKKGIVVYESSSVKAAKLIPFFMILSVGILIFLFLKKEI